MRTLPFIKITAVLLLALSINVSINSKAIACSRIVYNKGNNVFTARTMDWKGDLGSNIWIFPRGMQRNGAVNGNSVLWNSKYGSVVTSAFDFATCDGVNEKGLSANLLWLSNSKFPEKETSKPNMSLSIWAQYILDNFANVEEAVNELSKNIYNVLTTGLPGSPYPVLIHISISDSKGDNAILEYIDGKLKIHHGKEYTILTNEPVYEEQLAINDYWKSIGGKRMLPGTFSSSDRFVRAAYCIDNSNDTENVDLLLASVFSIIRAISVPLQLADINPPTIWRTVFDHGKQTYYFEDATTLNVFAINLNAIDFSVNASVKKFTISQLSNYSGNILNKFLIAEPFKFFEIK